jgi:hypothetical protein
LRARPLCCSPPMISRTVINLPEIEFTDRNPLTPHPPAEPATSSVEEEMRKVRGFVRHDKYANLTTPAPINLTSSRQPNDPNR